MDQRNVISFQKVKMFGYAFNHFFPDSQEDKDFIQTLQCIETFYGIIDRQQTIANDQHTSLDLKQVKKWILALCLRCNTIAAKKRRNKLSVQLLQ